jgi:hypothetical protein
MPTVVTSDGNGEFTTLDTGTGQESVGVPCSLHDDFTGGLGISAGSMGETGWSIRSTADAGHSTDPIPGEANHPGIWKVSCAPITNSILSVCRGVDSSSVLVNPYIVTDVSNAMFVVRPLSTNNERLLVGFAQDPIGATATVLNGGTSGFYAFYDPAVSANWLLRTRNASTNTDTDTGVALAGSRWYAMRFRRSGSNYSLAIGALGALSTGVVNTTNLPTGGLSATVSVQSTSAASRVMHFDYFSVQSSSLQRY